jgi:hypothetical protein
MSNVPKLTVYLSDELAARLDPFRDVLNLSEIAKAAIEERLRMEQAAAPEDIRERVLNRWRRGVIEKSAMQARGFDAGQEWAAGSASPKDMKTVAEWPEITSPFDVVPSTTAAGNSLMEIAMMAAVKTYVPKNRCLVPASLKATPPPGTKPEMVVLFWSGVANGVRSVYDLVKDDIQPEQFS